MATAVHELLAYIVHYRNSCSRSALLKVASGFFSAAEISNAKKCLLSEFDSHLSSTAFLTERRGSTVRPAQEAELDDIVGALEHIDSANVLKNITFVAADLSRLPGYGPEDTNICTIADRQQQIVSTVSKLSESVSQLHVAAADVNHVEQAVKVSVENSLAPFQVKFTELSNLCTHIAESLKPSSTSTSRVKVKDNADDKADTVDRSKNVVIFGIDEAIDTTDGTAWRDTVVQTLSTAAGRDVVIEDAFRLGRTVTTGRKRPVLVRLHSAWDRRIILSGSWKLSRKAGFEHIFIAPDEPVEIRRQKICDRLVKRATTRGQSVTVDNGTLSIDNQAVFSLERGFLHNDG